jgi:hypothetical protein
VDAIIQGKRRLKSAAGLECQAIRRYKTDVNPCGLLFVYGIKNLLRIA